MLQQSKKFLNDMAGFVRAVAEDPRIPSRDKKVVLALLALVISPIDIIPDWIPVFGWLDDFMIVAIVLDYFFEVLDQQIILSHYPWGMKSYTWCRRAAKMVSQFAPNSFKKLVWKFEGSPYSDKKD
jgi:uncharacterized membrane protein YkvA (DUF1232 family)